MRTIFLPRVEKWLVMRSCKKKTLGTITNQKKVCQMAHFPFECPDYKAIKRNLFIFFISFYITVLTWFTLQRNYFLGFVQDSNLIWILHFLVSFTNHKGDKNLACFKITVHQKLNAVLKYNSWNKITLDIWEKNLLEETVPREWISDYSIQLLHWQFIDIHFFVWQ